MDKNIWERLYTCRFCLGLFYIIGAYNIISIGTLIKSNSMCVVIIDIRDKVHKVSFFCLLYVAGNILESVD